jgi:hypothetical protein
MKRGLDLALLFSELTELSLFPIIRVEEGFTLAISDW